MNNSDNNLTALVERAMKKDEDAMEIIINRFHQKIFQTILYRVKSVDDAEDLCQDIFIKIFKNIKKLKNPEKFKTWMYSIALNMVKDFYKKRQILNFFGLASELDYIDNPSEPENHTESEASKKDFYKTLYTLLDKLTKNEREIFILKYLDNLTIREITTILNKGESTVKTLLYRSVKKLGQDEILLRNILEV